MPTLDNTVAIKVQMLFNLPRQVGRLCEHLFSPLSRLQALWGLSEKLCSHSSIDQTY